LGGFSWGSNQSGFWVLLLRLYLVQLLDKKYRRNSNTRRRQKNKNNESFFIFPENERKKGETKHVLILQFNFPFSQGSKPTGRVSKPR